MLGAFIHGFSSILAICAISGQFLKQPDAGNVFIPVQDQVTLTCSVEEGFVTDWRVVFSNGDSGEASDEIARRYILQQNFTLEGVATRRSTLSLRETETHTNNGTIITCIALHVGSTSFTAGNNVRVIFYGTPPTPTVNVSMNGLGSLKISWSLGFLEGVPVNYTLTILNLNTTSAQPIIIAGLLDQHYVFETSRPCDVYSFSVTAVTAAGNNILSEALISEMCFASTSENTIPVTSYNQLTTASTRDSATQPSTTQDNSNITLIITVCVAAAVITVLVLVNVIVCVCCYQKTKTVVKVDLSGPVYETPKDVLPLPSAKSLEAPYVMTTSSAYEVSMNPPTKFQDNNVSPTTQF